VTAGGKVIIIVNSCKNSDFFCAVKGGRGRARGGQQRDAPLYTNSPIFFTVQGMIKANPGVAFRKLVGA
jgi:hypothetical protein